MKDYLIKHDWKIIEKQYAPEHNQITESLMSLGNGHMGQRANFEETYSGESLQGTYVAGVYYPDKTKVGWWKNGYPEYFAKVLNSCNWNSLQIIIADEEVDVHKAKVIKWHRELDMQGGYLLRDMTIELPSGKQLQVVSTRINSMHQQELGAYRYELTPINFSAEIQITSKLDFDVVNADANYDEKFWISQGQESTAGGSYVVASTKKTNFTVAAAQKHKLTINNKSFLPNVRYSTSDKQAKVSFTVEVSKGDKLVLDKFAIVASSLNIPADNIADHVITEVGKAEAAGWNTQFQYHKDSWSTIWDSCDIEIQGDTSAQQGIRFNIFQLFQTYTGQDYRLNIGPKGFTGEKYGGSTYWDTEAYCIPFYLGTADPSVAKNLLVYRYKQLDKAIENAAKLGFTDGAALYPMVTMNGEECHNEWEITFEEIHRNGAIAYAIFDYIRYTGDEKHLAEYGFEVLLGISRFWAQRVNWSEAKQQYVMLGVTGPNEYENNVNNNWYTNYIAAWCLKYTLDCIPSLKTAYPDRWTELVQKTNFKIAEPSKWKDIIDKMYYPADADKGVFLQQDGFLDKELIPVADLPAKDRPLNQKWSWDRILRSCYIKQADVLQGFYFFEDDFDEETHRKNFLFYEPLTVHESSLSPCVHSILATKLGMEDKAYEMYLRTSRLDLDDYNNDTEDGCHITSMAGTWMAVVKGFGGQRVVDGKLSLAPNIPSQWEGLSFKINFRDVLFYVEINGKSVKVSNQSENHAEVLIYGKLQEIVAGEAIMVSR